jgi:hypothetical protein
MDCEAIVAFKNVKGNQVNGRYHDVLLQAGLEPRKEKDISLLSTGIIMGLEMQRHQIAL